MKRNLRFTFILFLICFLVPGCGGNNSNIPLTPAVPSPPEAISSPESSNPLDNDPLFAYRSSQLIDNTYLTLTFFDEDHQSICDSWFQTYSTLKSELDSSSETSQMFALNNLGETTLTLTSNQTDMIALGISYSELTQGAFDITSEPLRLIWDFSSGLDLLPTEEDIANALSHVNFEQVSLSGNILTFEQPGMSLNTAYYFDGYACEKLLQLLAEAGITNGILEFGSLSFYLGTNANNEPHAITLTVPSGEESLAIANVMLSNYAVFGAHMYDVYTETEDGIFYPMFDLHTGYPGVQDFTSVYVFSSSPSLAQVTAKACFSMSIAEGKTMLSNLPGTYALWITEDGSIVFSDGMTDHIQVVLLN